MVFHYYIIKILHCYSHPIFGTFHDNKTHFYQVRTESLNYFNKLNDFINNPLTNFYYYIQSNPPLGPLKLENIERKKCPLDLCDNKAL